MNENIKEIFEEPKLEWILFSAEDVVTASGDGKEIELPKINM